MASATNNQGGKAVDIDLTAEDDDGPFLSLLIEDSETLDTLANVIITEESDADDLLAEVTAAVEKFKHLKSSSSS